MREQKSGRIISFSSTSGLYGNPGQANYGAAKDGIAGMTRVVARELGKYGITVNAIAPVANTRMTASVPQASRDKRAERGIFLPPRQLFGEPEDVAPMVAYLATDTARDVNGQIFVVNAGLISRLNDPSPVRTITKTERWTPDEVARVFPRSFAQDMVNPAPPRAREG
jgi:NAD(P)-dependent dehydrogenase (short-subunit alcohol dehydrogenase family)